MSELLEKKSKKIVSEQLDVDPEQVVPEASFVDDLGLIPLT